MAERVPFRAGLFEEDAQGDTLIGNKCKSCGQIFFPSKASCLACFGDDMEEVRLSRRGKLYTFTISHMPTVHLKPPFAIGYIELPEGIKVFAPLVGWEEHPLKMNMEMELIIDKLWEDDGKEVVGYKFKPVL